MRRDLPAGTDSRLKRIGEDVADERRLERYGVLLSTIRVFLVCAVMILLLSVFSLLSVAPGSDAFYIAVIADCIDSLLLAGCLVLFFRVRKKYLAVMRESSARSRPPEEGGLS